MPTELFFLPTTEGVNVNKILAFCFSEGEDTQALSDSFRAFTLSTMTVTSIIPKSSHQRQIPTPGIVGDIMNPCNLVYDCDYHVVELVYK